jgi:ABC-type polysaccharide/polyol phosphate export permease
VNDIAARYRGSILGPFWITISTIAFVVGIGIVYGDLMHVSTEKYVPWMATGVVVWNMISITINEGAEAFLQGSQIIRQTSIPLPLFVWRVVLRNILNFGHQVVVILGVAIWFHFVTKMNVPLALVGLVLVMVNMAWMSFVAAILSARYRDVQQVIVTVLQLVFFVSPVLWIPNDLRGVRSLLLTGNPVFHMLAVVRDPLLARPANWTNYLVLIVMAAAGWAATLSLYAVVRRRIVHYL